MEFKVQKTVHGVFQCAQVLGPAQEHRDLLGGDEESGEQHLCEVLERWGELEEKREADRHSGWRSRDDGCNGAFNVGAISLGDIQNMPTLWVLALFGIFYDCCFRVQTCRHLGGGGGYVYTF